MSRRFERDPRFAHLVEMDQPHIVIAEVLEEIEWACKNRERNLQEEIGPSALGAVCDWELAGMLDGRAEPGDERDLNWQAEVGTFMHAGFEDIMRRSALQKTDIGPRFLLEIEVVVGVIDGRTIKGHIDCYDRLSGGVIDWKTKSKTQMIHHKRHGMGQEYATQAQSYGYALAQQSFPVNWTCDVFFPRDGNWSDVFYKAEPYDESVALAALARADHMAKLVRALGYEAVTDMYPPCGNRYCRWCPAPRAFRPGVIDPDADPLAG